MSTSRIFEFVYCFVCFIDPRLRKVRNEASSCPGMFSKTMLLAPPVCGRNITRLKSNIAQIHVDLSSWFLGVLPETKRKNTSAAEE